MISLIIPTLNEARALPLTLNALQGLTGDFEIIVSDGGSHDRTQEIVRNHKVKGKGCKLICAPRGRGSQMNVAAQQAVYDWLLFLHADTLLPDDAIAQILDVSRQSGVQWGCFHHRFSGDDWRLRLISRLHNWRFKRTLTIYGDQAMFVRRDTFMALGGFPEQPMEDVLFSEKLLTQSRPVMLPGFVVSDSRKFEQIGIWRALFYVFGIQLNHLRQRPLQHQSFFENYR